MGLDVYMYRCADPGAVTEYSRRQEAAHEEIYAKLKTEFGLQEDASGAAIPEALWRKFGKKTDAWDRANPPTVTEDKVEEDSQKYPKHMFKVGYLHSSYNEAGTNRILKNATGKDLYYIFEPDNRYRFTPDWNLCLVRAKEVRALYVEHLQKVGTVRVIEVRENIFAGSSVSSQEEAMKIFVAEQERHNERFQQGSDHPFASKDHNWYGSRDGDFFLGKGIEVLAAIPGASSFGKGKSVYLVVRDPAPEKSEEKDWDNWYLAALDVVIETCEWVLAQVNPNEYCLHWSS